ncbi:MAG: hypothetical protein H7289_07935 [Mucilaginibacter sp.]|nr:hypothetical protein [Mucilaginibacter sp.]
MKKIALISAIALSGLFYSNANAQLRIGFGLHVNTPSVRIEAQTASPVYTEYSNADDYYYMPEVDAYYSPYERVYYYNDGGRWVSNAYLPDEYRNYDWRTARRYEVRAHRPYLNADIYREKYRGNARDWNRRDDRFDNRRDDRFDNRRDDRFDNRRDYRFDNRNDRRDDGPRFVKPNEYRGAEHADNRGWGNGNRRDDRNDNRGEGNYNQPQQQQGRGQGNYNQQPQQSQPSQPSRSDNNGQGRGQGGYNQPSQPQQNQPSRQNGGGQQRGGMNQGDHLVFQSSQNDQRRF